MKIIFDNVNKLDRSSHWAGVMSWYDNVKDYIQKIHLVKSYEDLTHIEKIKIGVFAMTTGNIDYDDNLVVNKDFKQSANLVDFVHMDSLEDILEEMDVRSDPGNYMRSQLERSLAKHAVSTKYRIALVWDGREYKDDLDLDVKWTASTINGKEVNRIYYANPTCTFITPHEELTTHLDFDANAGQKIDEPAENISCVPYGMYRVRVNNYARCTVDKDIPFTVIIHQEGNEDVIFESVAFETPI